MKSKVLNKMVLIDNNNNICMCSKEFYLTCKIRLNSISKQVERIKSQYEEQKKKIQEINKKMGY